MSAVSTIVDRYFLPHLKQTYGCNLIFGTKILTIDMCLISVMKSSISLILKGFKASSCHLLVKLESSIS